MSRRIAIVGSRDYVNLWRVKEYVDALPIDTTVISGGARGVDRRAAQAARARGLTVVEHLADWSRGRGAGYERNLTIVDDCTEVTAFWDGVSMGTAHTIHMAEKAGKPVTVIYDKSLA